MAIEIKVPSLGESISSATISALLVQSGSKVARDQEIMEIETEKVNQILFAPEAGILTLNVKVGDVVKIGQVVAHVEVAKEGAAPVKPEVVKPAVSVPSKVEEKVVIPPAEVKEESKGHEPLIFDEIRKSPEAFIEELRTPSIVNTQSHAVANPLEESVEAPKSEREERKKMSKIRQTIARRLVEAKQTMAILTTFNEVDMSAVMDLRKKHKESFEKTHGVRLGFMSFFLKAACTALKKFPQVNAYIDGDDIVIRKYIDINVAISSERGLVVPIIENCDQKSFADIEKKIVDLASRAKDAKLSIDEMRSGGFTISNGGVFGSTFSTPIVNPPQSAILGMHRIVDRPYAIDGKIVIRPIMVLALSYDHRIIDGQEAVSFLAQIVKIIEDPTCLLIDL